MKCYKVLSCLLDYPTDDLWQAKDELIDVINSSFELSNSHKLQLIEFINDYFSLSLLDAQAMYYQTFEIGNMTSLLLFEHVHGDSRDRGQAMVELIEQYAEQGIELATNQLPDYLPIFLEYLSVLSKADCQKWLNNIALIIHLLALRLEKRESRYQVILQVIYQLSQCELVEQGLQQRVAEEQPDNTTEAIDKAWLETQVLFQGPVNQDKTKSINNSTYYITVGEDSRSCS